MVLRLHYQNECDYDTNGHCLLINTNVGLRLLFFIIIAIHTQSNNYFSDSIMQPPRHVCASDYDIIMLFESIIIINIYGLV